MIKFVVKQKKPLITRIEKHMCITGSDMFRIMHTVQILNCIETLYNYIKVPKLCLFCIYLQQCFTIIIC